MQTIEPVVYQINRVVLNLHKSASEICKVIKNPKYRLASKLDFEGAIEDIAQNIKSKHPGSNFYNLPDPSSITKIKVPNDTSNDAISKFKTDFKATIKSNLQKYDQTIKSTLIDFSSVQVSLINDINTITNIYKKDRTRFEDLNFPKEAFNALSNIFLVFADNVLRTSDISIRYSIFNVKSKDETRKMINISYPASYELFTEMHFFFKNLASKSPSIEKKK